VRYGLAVGQAFQIADDLLDLEGDPALVGKQTGKDAQAGKATIVGILGRTGAKARLGELIAEAAQALTPFGAAAAVLNEGARFVADRQA
jgi:farnesyl diphosphate synthase